MKTKRKTKATPAREPALRRDELVVDPKKFAADVRRGKGLADIGRELHALRVVGARLIKSVVQAVGGTLKKSAPTILAGLVAAEMKKKKGAPRK